MSEPERPAVGLPTALFSGLQADPAVRLAFGAFGVYAVAALVAGGLPRTVGLVGSFLVVALAFLALHSGLHEIRTAEEKIFWQDLRRGAACWLAVPVVYLALSRMAAGALCSAGLPTLSTRSSTSAST